MRACRAHRETCEACTVQVRGRSNKPSSYYEGLVDVMEELYKFTFMTRNRADYLVTAVVSAEIAEPVSLTMGACVYARTDWPFRAG
jgi:CRISPR/Cas system-associated protein Csm6